MTEHCWFSYRGQTTQLDSTGEDTIHAGHAITTHAKAHQYNSTATNTDVGYIEFL